MQTAVIPDRHSPSVWIPESVKSDLLAKSASHRATFHGGDGHEYAVLDTRDPLWQELQKSARAPNGMKATGIPRRINPMLYQMGAYRGITSINRAQGLTNQTLRQMAQTPILASIINTIRNMVAAYSIPFREERKAGFSIMLKKSSKTMTRSAKKKAQQIEDILMAGGMKTAHSLTGEIAVWDGNEEDVALDFCRANQMLFTDSMVLDYAGVRIEAGSNPKRFPIVFMRPVDAAQIRKTVPKATTPPADAINRFSMAQAASSFTAGISDQYVPEIREPTKHIKYVEMGQDGLSVVREYAWNEFAEWIRNPRTDIMTNGYGHSELEFLIEVVIGLSSGMKFNTEFFTKNHVPPGFLFLMGQYNEEWLEDFEMDIEANVGGASQYWRLPVLVSDDSDAKANYVSVREQGRLDMHWKEWITFLINLTHSVYGISPELTGWTSYSTKTNSLQEADPQTKIESSQDRFFRPVMRQNEEFWTEKAVARIDSDFCFVYRGLDPINEEQAQKAASERLQVGLTIPSEERAEQDRPEIIDPKDGEQWEACQKAMAKKFPDLEEEDPDQFREWCVKLYKYMGGKLALWPQAPTNMSQLQVWMQEHSEDLQPAQPDMGMMGPDGQEQDPNAGYDRWGMEPPGGAQSPEKDQGPPPQGQLPPGQAPPQPPQYGQPMGKSFNRVIEVVVR